MKQSHIDDIHNDRILQPSISLWFYRTTERVMYETTRARIWKWDLEMWVI